MSRFSSCSPAMAATVCALVALSCARPVAVRTHQVTRTAWTHRVTTEGFLVAAQSELVVVPSEVRHGGRVVWMAEDGAEVEAGQVVLRLDHYQLEQQLEQELADLESADVDRRRSAVEGRSSVDDAVTRKELAALDLDHATRFRRDDESVFSKNEIADSQIEEELARTRRGHAARLESIEEERARAEAGRIDVERRIAAFEVDLSRAALEALELRAPRSGVLVWSRDWRGEITQIGTEVSRGQVLAEIPDFSDLLAEVFALEADADGIAAGQRAEIAIDASPGTTYAARVLRVDPIAKRRFRGSPTQYVGIKLGLDAVDSSSMKPGQRVTASIVVGEEPAAIVLPRLAIFVDDAGYFVHLLRDGEFVRAPVEVSSVTSGLALIAEGVEEGDTVALTEPSGSTAAPNDQAAGG